MFQREISLPRRIKFNLYKLIQRMYNGVLCSIVTRNRVKYIYICAVGSLSDVRGESRGYVEIFEECRAYAPALSETRYKMRGCEKPDRTTHATRCDELGKNLPSRFIHLTKQPICGAVSTITVTFRPAGMGTWRIIIWDL